MKLNETEVIMKLNEIDLTESSTEELFKLEEKIEKEIYLRQGFYKSEEYNNFKHLLAKYTDIRNVSYEKKKECYEIGKFKIRFIYNRDNSDLYYFDIFYTFEVDYGGVLKRFPYIHLIEDLDNVDIFRFEKILNYIKNNENGLNNVQEFSNNLLNMFYQESHVI